MPERRGGACSSLWRSAMLDDRVVVSSYGQSTVWEDMAEFSVVYAASFYAKRLGDLKRASPKRFELWTRCLASVRKLPTTCK